MYALKSLTVVAWLYFVVPIAHTAIILVPSEQPTIQQGIDAASIGDTVLVAEGTYTGDGNRDLNPGGKYLLVVSISGPESTIIDCQASEADRHRGVYFNSGGDSLTVIEGFTIRNGVAPYDGTDYRGGGVHCQSGKPTFRNCIIEDCEADKGGGVFVCYSSASPMFEGCMIRNCQGRGIWCEQGSYHLRDCILDNNSGAIWQGMSMPSTIDSCLFLGHDVRSGISSCCAATISVSNSIFDRCVGAFSGSDWVGADFTNCTFYACRNAVSGRWGASVDLDNCVLAFGSDGDPVSTDSENPGSFQLSCCDIYGNAAGDWVGVIAGQATISGNFSADPLFCDTTVSDFHLDIISPCAPDNNSCGALIGAFDVGCICCDSVGDIDHDGEGPNIEDLIFLVNYMFQEGPTPECFGNADADGNGSVPDIADLIYLVNFMFQEGPALVPCP